MGGKSNKKISMVWLIAFSMVMAGLLMHTFVPDTPEGEINVLQRLAGFLSGAGCGLLAVASVFALINMRKSPEERHREEIAAKDERSKGINAKAGSVAYFASCLVFLAESLAGLLTDTKILNLFGICGLYAVVITFFVSKKIFENKN